MYIYGYYMVTLFTDCRKMPTTPENDRPTSTEVQPDSTCLAADEKREPCMTSNGAHIEVPVGSLTVQDTSMENQPDEQQMESQRSAAEEAAETGRDATLRDESVTAANDDDVSEKQLNLTERREEAADEGITSMSVQVRSGAQVSVACGEGADHASNEAHSVKSRANNKRASPIFQYSSDAAATGMCRIVSIFVSCLKCQLVHEQVYTLYHFTF